LSSALFTTGNTEANADLPGVDTGADGPRAIVGSVPRNMDDQLGSAGMPLLDTLGVSFDAYGEGWSSAVWTPTDVCANPIGVVQAGVHAVVLDAACNFALLAGLERGEHGVTVEMKVANLRAALVDDELVVRGDALRIGTSVAHLEATVSTSPDGDKGSRVVSKASATFAVQRRDD